MDWIANIFEKLVSFMQADPGLGLITLAVADPQCSGFAVWQAGAAVPVNVPARVFR